MILSALYRYPLKGGRGESLDAAPALGTGLPHDRRWLLIHANGRFMSQRECAKMALIETQQQEQRLLFQYKNETLTLPQPTSAALQRTVTVWGDKVEAWDLGDDAAAFFSRITGQPTRLCEAKPEGVRQVGQDFTEGRRVDYLFADAFPYLVISQESLDLLNEKLAAQGLEQVSMDRFRPNIVIKGWQAHAEDQVQTLNIGGRVRLRLSKLCARCNVPTIDQQTGETGVEPVRTLASYRRLSGSKIFFGANAWVASGAGQIIRLGDAVTVEP